MLKSLSRGVFSTYNISRCNLLIINQHFSIASTNKLFNGDSQVFTQNAYNGNNNNNNKSYDAFTNTKKYTNEWKRILTTAEKVVGYPTSFLNLRYLVSDEVANFASLLRKLMLTNHPLIDIAKNLVNEPNKYTQMIGLIVLLVSKASGVPQKLFISTEINDGIHQSQRTLAEISEMINMAFVIHRGIMDLKFIKSKEYEDINNGNRIAVLCGDFLLAKACTNLAKLQNTQVVEIISQVIADISQIIFLEEKLQSKPDSFVGCWYEKTFRLSSSLLANSCKATLLLVNHPAELQAHVWNFTHNLDITHKIWLELNQFKQDDDIFKSYTLLNAIYCDKYANSAAADEAETRINIRSSEKSKIVLDVLKQSVSIFDKHYSLALNNLELIRTENTNEDAMDSLKSILNIMKTSIVSLS